MISRWSKSSMELPLADDQGDAKSEMLGDKISERLQI